MSWKQSEMVHVRTNTFHSICKLQQRERQISTFWMAILLMLHCSWAGVEVISQNKRSSWWFQILRNVLPSEIASSEDMYLQLVWKHGQGEISKDSNFDVNPAHSGLWVNPFLFYRYNSGTHRIPSQLDSNLDSNRLDCPLMRPSHR